MRMVTTVQPVASTVSRHSSRSAIEPAAPPAVSPLVDSAVAADTAHLASSPLHAQSPALPAKSATAEPFSVTSSIDATEENLQAVQSADETVSPTTHARGHPPTAPLVRLSPDMNQLVEHAAEQPTARPAEQTTAQPANQLMEKTTAQPANQLVEKTTAQPANQPVKQTIAQPANQPTVAEPYSYQAISNGDPVLPWAPPEQSSSSVVAGLTPNEPPQTQLPTPQSNATSNQSQISPTRSELPTSRRSRSPSPQTLDQPSTIANHLPSQEPPTPVATPSSIQASLKPCLFNPLCCLLNQLLQSSYDQMLQQNYQRLQRKRSAFHKPKRSATHRKIIHLLLTQHYLCLVRLPGNNRSLGVHSFGHSQPLLNR